jgi:hypothetical protein
MAATSADAHVIMQLYDLRREPEMRKARSWFVMFDPQSVDELISCVMALDSDASRYFRMVTGYWEMAAQMVLHGAVDEPLFLDTQPEMFLVFAKLAPHIAGLRDRLQMPESMKAVEELVNRSAAGKKKLQAVTQRIARLRALAAEAKRK